MRGAQLCSCLKVVSHGSCSGIFYTILLDVQDILFPIQLVVFPFLLLFRDSLMHVHHHHQHGFLPKDHVRQTACSESSITSCLGNYFSWSWWKLSFFFYLSLEYSLYVFFWQPLPHKNLLFLPGKYCLTRTGMVFFRQTDRQVWPLQVVPLTGQSCAHCMAVTVQSLPSLQHSSHRADSH